MAFVVIVLCAMLYIVLQLLGRVVGSLTASAIGFGAMLVLGVALIGIGFVIAALPILLPIMVVVFIVYCVYALFRGTPSA